MGPRCPCCPGRGVLLGALGLLKWYRCRDCGINFNRKSKARWARKASA